MVRRWVPTGVSPYHPTEISPERREQIRLEVQDKGIAVDVPVAFYESLEMAIGLFHSGRALAEADNPARVRENLQAAIDAVRAAIDATHALNGKLDALDNTSQQLIGSDGQRAICALQDIHPGHVLDVLQRALQEAYRLAGEHSARGRPPDYARLLLAIDVADAIKTHLGAKPTSTKEGLFDSVLSIVLEIASDREDVKSVHDLVLRALKVEVEKCPPPENPPGRIRPKPTKGEKSPE